MCIALLKINVRRNETKKKKVLNTLKSFGLVFFFQVYNFLKMTKLLFVSREKEWEKYKRKKKIKPTLKD